MSNFDVLLCVPKPKKSSCEIKEFGHLGNIVTMFGNLDSIRTKLLTLNQSNNYKFIMLINENLIRINVNLLKKLYKLYSAGKLRVNL